ncbi:MULTISPECIES: efflux transporter outer membrane subunit [Ramlibacter]|uniref:Efflux transporter outer membrane subunit n=1 Tax=Ramlibacter aquaticus TaxID=2780094 RepID=A0ABR9SDL6_9BURK|nr:MULTISPECIES: efflux transporter outer membrane subunit [Ramlibacter]MBE7940453.1 efflux transporter outer membrane subunit [Ramlibacter aquaticus]
MKNLHRFRRAALPLRPARLAGLAGLVLALAGCAVAPAYQRPVVDTPVAFKEGAGTWVPAAPADALDRGPWWAAFQDEELSGLMARVEVSNNNVAAAVARYRQARALVAQQRAALFPTVNLTAGADRSGNRAASGAAGAGGTGSGAFAGVGANPRDSFQFGIGASWEPDLWGRLAGGVDAARAGEQASAADLAAARLSAQGELAVDWFNLRQLDVARALQARTITGYERSLRITQNRYQAGIAARTDVLQAQTQLANAQADLLGYERQRAVLEHAIAVLVGQAPAGFSLPQRAEWQAVVPQLPEVLPSTLLQRRPDIAAAERRVAQANAQVGVALAGWFPQLGLSANAGLGAAAAGELFRASSLTWALGLSLAQNLFNGGATTAQVESARAGVELAAAQYRQTVLSAFQAVEDQLVASRVLAQQRTLREQAAQAATLAEQQVLNRYEAGQVGFTEVVTAQATAASARQALAQATADREVAAVSLIQALGGGWQAP